MNRVTATDQRNENVSQRLSDACVMLEKDWNQQKQSWNTYDRNWYSLSSERLCILANSLQLFIQSSKFDINVEWLIATYTYDILKNILLHPDVKSTADHITPLVWQLIFELTRNSDNHISIWGNYKDIFFNCLQCAVYMHKDICRLSIYNIIRFGQIAQHDDTKTLNIILQNFHDEIEENPSKKEGLNVFLEYFIIDNKQISTLYRTLETEKRLWLLQIVAEHIGQGHFNVLPISIDLLTCICEEFKVKNGQIINTDSKSADNMTVLELVALFKVIAYASNEAYYEINYLEDDLLYNIGQFLRNLILNEIIYEDAYLFINRADCINSLKIMVLKTISYLVQGSQRNQNLVRKEGILADIVAFLCSFGKDQVIYAHSVLTIFDICDMNVANEEYVKDFVANKNDGNSEILRTLLIDVKYKKNKMPKNFY